MGSPGLGPPWMMVGPGQAVRKGARRVLEAVRVLKVMGALMQRVCGTPALSRVFKRSCRPYTLCVADAGSSCQMRARCIAGMNSLPGTSS